VLGGLGLLVAGVVAYVMADAAGRRQDLLLCVLSSCGSVQSHQGRTLANLTTDATGGTRSMAFGSIVSVLVRFVDASYFGQVAGVGVGGLVRWG
jgi:hypothetical protein